MFEVLSLLIQALAALAAVAALFFIGIQIKHARKTADLQTLQTFLKDTREHDRAFAEARTSEEQNHAFVEYLNFLETYAAAINGGLIPEVSQPIVHEKILDSAEIIKRNRDWHDQFVDAVSSDSTFEHLAKLTRENQH